MRYDVVRDPGWEVRFRVACPVARYAVIVRFSPRPTGSATGSDTIWAPTGTVTDRRPPNVSGRLDPGTMAGTPARPPTGRATAAAVSGRAAPPKALEKRTRTR